MIRFLSAVAADIETLIADDLLSAGHDLLGRCEPSMAATEAERLGAEVVLVEAGMLSRLLIRESDARGIRLIALARSATERRYAISLDFFEVVDLEDGWAGVEQGLRIPGPPNGAAIPGPEFDVASSRSGAANLRAENTDSDASLSGNSSAEWDAVLRADQETSQRGPEQSVGSRSSAGLFRERQFGDLGYGASTDPASTDAANPSPNPTSPNPVGRDHPLSAGAVTPLRPGSVIVVWGPAGAPGRSTLALNIAAELASTSRRVALVDADCHAASLATQLGLLDESPAFAIACRLAGTGDLDHRELERLAQLIGHPPLWVLPGISRSSRWPELTSSKVAAVLKLCRSWADYTVVDVAASLESDEELSSDVHAPRRNAATLTALRTADLVVVVGSADPVGISRLLRAHLELTEQVEPERLLLLINRVRSSAVGLGPVAQISRTLARFGGIEPAGFIPDDRNALDAAVLAGTSLRESAPKSPARQAITKFVRERIAVDAPARVKRRAVRAKANAS